MKKIMALLLICLVLGFANDAFAAQKIMTVYQRAAGDEAMHHKIDNFKDFAAPVGTGVAVTSTKITLGGARNTDGAVWYGGDSDAGYCVNGICNFGIGIRAYFEFRFLTVDNNANSQTYGNGFTFAIINGSNNDKTKRGGGPGATTGFQALMAYAGPGSTSTTDGLGLEPPKMAIEFDTWPNRGLATNTPCTNDNRYDANNANNFNHLALMLWGTDTATPTCTGGYSRTSYDDNVHGVPTTGTTTNPTNSARGDGTGGYYEGPTVTWLEDNVVYSFRIEIIRESISTDNVGNYIVRAWVVAKSSLNAAQLATFKDTSIPYPPTPTGLSPQINRTIELSSALHTNFNTMLFGFTQATSSTTSQAQNIEITNFNIYFPPCGSDEPPGGGWTWCAYENPTPPAPGPFSCSWSGGGTKLVAYGRNCIYNYQYRTSGVDCSNSVFGDPHVGVYKKCYYK